MSRVCSYFDIKRDQQGSEYMEVYLDGIVLLRLVMTNKGSAFTAEERVALGLEGLLPPQINTLEQQLDRVYAGLRREPSAIAKYQYLRALQEREALPEELIEWTIGRALVCTGSPCPAVNFGGKTYPIGQGNNAFIFPGLGFGAILAEAREITDGMVLAAAYALAAYTEEKHLASGLLYPPIGELQEVSIRVAAQVIAQACAEEGVARSPKLDPAALRAYVHSHFWKARYLPFVRGRENATRPEEGAKIAPRMGEAGVS